eukprot:Opistho-1_new@13549
MAFNRGLFFFVLFSSLSMIGWICFVIGFVRENERTGSTYWSVSVENFCWYAYGVTGLGGYLFIVLYMFFKKQPLLMVALWISAVGSTFAGAPLNECGRFVYRCHRHDLPDGDCAGSGFHNQTLMFSGTFIYALFFGLSLAFLPQTVVSKVGVF